MGFPRAFPPALAALAAGAALFALSGCGSPTGSGSAGGSLSSGEWRWDGGRNPWRSPADGLQYASMSLTLSRGNAPEFVLLAEYGSATPGRDCSGTERRGYWDADVPAGEMLLTVVEERESCDPEKEPEELYRRETVLLRSVTARSFEACFAECDRDANWLPFRLQGAYSSRGNAQDCIFSHEETVELVSNPPPSPPPKLDRLFSLFPRRPGAAFFFVRENALPGRVFRVSGASARLSPTGRNARNC